MKQDVIGFRPQPFLRKQIIDGAARSGHSVSEEIQVRLLQAYLDKDSPLSKMLPSGKITASARSAAAEMLLKGE